MNVFVIPSWYPSLSNSLNGIFVKEQVIAMSKMYSDINFGISTWGQNDEDFLLYAGRPISSIQKSLKSHPASINKVSANLEEYFSPAFSFTNKVLKGNIKKTVEANCVNLKAFEARYGKPDIIHAHVSYKAGYIAQQISEKYNIPYVITEHMGPFPQKYHLDNNGNLLKYIKDAIESSHAMLAVSSDLAAVIKSYGIKKEIKVMPNFIEPVAQSKKTLRNADNFSFVTVSGMSEGKGIGELLKGIKIALKSEPRMHFTMVGGGPDLEYFKQLTVDLEIENNVTWTGMVPKEKVSDYLVASDVHILTSYYDSFGVAYVEAMAHGIPNIAAAIGGPKDIIDQETGILIEKVDAEMIAEKIIWAKKNYHSFDRETILRSFQNRFSTQAVAPRIRGVYERLIHSR